MNIAAAPGVDLPPDFASIDEAEIVTERPIELAVQCVLYVGDILTTRQKKGTYTRLGGKLFPYPTFYTVPHNVVARCQITRLQKHMRSVPLALLPEADHETWRDRYTLKNHWNPVTRKFEDLLVGGVTEAEMKAIHQGAPGSNPARAAQFGLRYKEIRPVHEIGMIAHQNDGVIALGSDCGIEKGSDIREAQQFYFPEWDQILLGKKFLPDRLSVLREHIMERRGIAQSSQLRAIGDAFLLSCTEYYDWSAAYVSFQASVIAETADKPGAARHDEIAERMFATLGLQRQDKLVEDMARDRDANAGSTAAVLALAKELAASRQGSTQMETAISLLAKIVADQNVPVAAADQPPLPTTVEEVEAEILRATEESTFTDMSEVIIDSADELVDQYLKTPADDGEGEADLTEEDEE